MRCSRLLGIVLAFTPTLMACAADSPLAPDATRAELASAAIVARGVEGTYTLSFAQTSPELVLRAYVAELATGLPAHDGSANFQICVRKGGPTLQMRPLASAECDNGGSGTWVKLGSMPIDPATGDAFLDFGYAPQFTTVGFRFRYNPQGGAILAGVSDPLDFVP